MTTQTLSAPRHPRPTNLLHSNIYIISILILTIVSLGVDAERERLKTPRAAAVAGVLFVLLFGGAMTLLCVALPESLTDEATATSLKGAETTCVGGVDAPKQPSRETEIIR
ncbi:hypothetical protein FBQ82_03115 [Anaerolineae bacterium CFX7]|nr:hypothetical protein [Anaerolineae bacterium CFX7]